jgi:DnaK suppressor protein
LLPELFVILWKQKTTSPFYGGTMNPNDLEFFDKLLKETLRDLSQRGSETLDEMTDNREIHADPADRATMETDRSFMLRLRDRERKLIPKIQEALARIQNGTYGVCEDCGEDISIERLKARPVTTLCIKCKSQREKEEQLRGE